MTRDSEDASLGYGFVMLPQIEPDLIGVRVTCGDATAVCRNQTRLSPTPTQE